MSAFIKMGDLEGESTDQNHEGWIFFETLDSSILRSIQDGAKDQERSRGETSLCDIVVTRQLDKTSPKLAEACATGTYYPEVEIHFCTDVGAVAEPYLTYKLKDVIVSSYSFNGNKRGNPLPTESVNLNYTEIEWTYIVIDPKTGQKQGNVVGSYVPGKNTTA